MEGGKLEKNRAATVMLSMGAIITAYYLTLFD